MTYTKEMQSNLFITDTKGTGISVRIMDVRFREVGFIWISFSQGPSELSVIERCPYYRGVRKERFHCTYQHSKISFLHNHQCLTWQKEVGSAFPHVL